MISKKQALMGRLCTFFTRNGTRLFVPYRNVVLFVMHATQTFRVLFIYLP